MSHTGDGDPTDTREAGDPTPVLASPPAPADAHTLARSVELPDRYTPRRVLGRGGMGAVIAVFDATLGREIAVKILPDSVRNDHVTRERFLREARAAAKLRHPNIVTVHDVDLERGYLVMELVQGRSLATRLRDEGKLALAEVRDVGAQLLDALEAAHRAGIVHRDVKPANLLIDEAGTVKLADFGVAVQPDSELTRPGTYVGTPAYMAPEQLRGRNVDGRADLYSAGVTLFQAATGRKLHSEQAPVEDPAALLRAETGDEAFARAILRAIDERPDRRFQTAAEMRDALAAEHVGRAAFDSIPPTGELSVSRSGERELAVAPPPLLRVSMTAAVVVLLAAALYLGSRLAGYDPLAPVGTATVPANVSLEEKVPAHVVRVGLLPFRSSSGTGAGELDFAEAGLPHLIGAELARVPGVTVVGYYRLLGLVGRADAPLDAWIRIARELEVDVVVRGELSAQSGQVRVAIDVAQPGGRTLASVLRVVEPRAVPETVRGAIPEIASAAIGQQVALEPGVPRAFELERRLLLGAGALEQHRIPDARRELEAALQVDPRSAEVHYYLAVAAWWDNRSADETLAHVDAALEGRLDEPRRRFLGGLRLLIAYQFKECIDWFESAVAAFPQDRDLLYGLFEALYHGGRPAESMVIYRRLAELHPEFRLGMIHALSYYLVHADEEGMDWAIGRTAAFGENVHAAWGPRASIARRRHAQAIEELGRLSESHGQLENLWLHTALVEAYAASGQVELAVAHQLRMKDLRPVDTAIVMLALAMARGADTDEAVWRRRAHDEAGKLEPGREPMDAWISLALIELPRGDRARLEEISRLLETAPVRERSADLRFHMTRALLAGALGHRELLVVSAKSQFPEVASAARAHLAAIDGDRAAAAAAWRTAAEHSADGRFYLIEQLMLARALAATGELEGVVRACGEVVEPRLMDWSWGAASAPCLALTAEALDALGRTAEARAIDRRLLAMRSAAPAADPPFTSTARARLAQ